jgi:hypothetical protein
VLAIQTQTHGGADLPGCAVAALERVVIDEGLLKQMQRSVLGQPFDCRDLGAVFHDRQRQARVDPPAVDENGARAALTVIASFLGTGETDVFTKRIEQRRPRSDVELDRGSIDSQCNRTRAGQPRRGSCDDLRTWSGVHRKCSRVA